MTSNKRIAVTRSRNSRGRSSASVPGFTKSATDASGVTATHSFPTVGDYTVGLRVTDANGEIHTTTTTVAVNLDPDESKLDPLDTEIIRKMVEPKVVEEEEAALATEATTAEEKAEQRSRAKDLAKEKRQRLWRYIIFAVLALILFEIWYSAHCRNKELKPQEPEAQ